ncbi:polynucleotide kinase [Serratia phage X20]|uniref:Polynucleotide kinase n=1 Tax=Serratia phage X20 TaxID=2006942 RepID=A0A1Z1LZE7_9CAUD|nr:polynucleotide kinase [Serratia phage X20]ARW58199.1 polynucleotide kinase [Serratia phage X20]
MKKIILTQGAPGSGKTTWANEYVSKNPGFYILSRDDFREKLFGLDYRNQYKYTKSKEKAVSKSQFASAEALLSIEGSKGVIIADTNLNPTTIKAWQELATKLNAKIDFERFDVPWTELLKRNQYRGDKAVPIDVLRSFYAKMSVPMTYVATDYPSGRPQAVIFDLDGTLADNEHRSPYDLDKLSEDTPREMVVLLLKLLQKQGFKILTVSGRESGNKDEPLKHMNATTDWLVENKIHTDKHFQRKQGDSRKDDVVKEEIFWNDIVEDYDVVLAVDDRAQVVEMWRRIGIECWQVNHGDF